MPRWWAEVALSSHSKTGIYRLKYQKYLLRAETLSYSVGRWIFDFWFSALLVCNFNIFVFFMLNACIETGDLSMAGQSTIASTFWDLKDKKQHIGNVDAPSCFFAVRFSKFLRGFEQTDWVVKLSHTYCSSFAFYIPYLQAPTAVIQWSLELHKSFETAEHYYIMLVHNSGSAQTINFGYFFWWLPK